MRENLKRWEEHMSTKGDARSTLSGFFEDNKRIVVKKECDRKQVKTLMEQLVQSSTNEKFKSNRQTASYWHCSYQRPQEIRVPNPTERKPSSDQLRTLPQSIKTLLMT